MLFLSCMSCFHARVFVDTLWSPAGKGLSSNGSRLRCLIVTLSLSHRYPGSSVVLECIHS